MLRQSYSSIPLSERLCFSHPCSHCKNANGFLSFVRCLKRNASDVLWFCVQRRQVMDPHWSFPFLFFLPFEEVKKELLHVPSVLMNHLLATSTMTSVMRLPSMNRSSSFHILFFIIAIYIRLLLSG